MGIHSLCLELLFYSQTFYTCQVVSGSLLLSLLQNIVFSTELVNAANLRVSSTSHIFTHGQSTSIFKTLSDSIKLPTTNFESQNVEISKFPDNVNCPVNYYQCPNASQCILISHLCDGIVHCPKAVDEGEHCTSNSCMSSTCQYGCRPSVKGPLCFCPEGKTYNGTHCEVLSTPSQFLLYTVPIPPSVRGAAISASSFSSIDVIPPVYTSGEVVALTHDPERTELYFCEKKSYIEIIYKQNIISSHREVVFDKGISSCSGLAADIAGYNLYWSDQKLGTISVVSLHNTTVYRILAKNETSKPRDIVLYLNKGYMFWIDQAFPSIQKAFLDGRQQSTLLASNLHTPQLLTLDTCLDKLFWWDAALNSLEGISVNGYDRKVIIRSQSTSHISGLVVFNGYAFWTDKDNLSIAELKSKSVKMLNISNGTRLLQVFSAVNNEGDCNAEIKSLCQNKSTECSDLCLTLPPDEHVPYICVCQEGYYFDIHNDECKTSSTQHCNEEEYQCQDGTCIPMSFVCDGQQDCFEENEEEIACSNFSCPSERFSCGNGRCIPMSWVCDGHIDCTSASDESFCGTLKYCSYPSHLCDNGTVCLDKHKVCDGFVDCNDGSDEHCEIHKLQPCEQWGYCSQLCHSLGNTSICDCSDGFRLLDDKRTCKSKDNTPVTLFYTTGIDINLYSVENDTHTVLLSGLQHVVYITFSSNGNDHTVIWSDVGTDKIYSAKFNGSVLSDISVIISTHLESVEGLAVDWVGSCLYWIESHHKHIEVAKLDGSFRTSLISGLLHPRGIAVDPDSGYLFWADWNKENPRIERSNLGGTDRKIIINVHQVDSGGWPNGVTLDYATKSVYWIDGKSGSIHTVDYDGHNHHEIYKSPVFVNPFSVDVFENYVFWTDRKVLAKVNRWTTTERKDLFIAYPHLYDVKVFHPSRQPLVRRTLCSKNNGNCSHLCLLGSNKTAVCACPYGMTLMKDGKTCKDYDLLISYVITERQKIFLTSAEKHLFSHLFPPIDLDNSVEMNTLTIDSIENCVYWIEGQKIMKQHFMEGSAKSIIQLETLQPKALTLDSASGNLYVMSQVPDSSRNEPSSHISICTTEGYYFTDIIWDHIHEPLSLAVDSTNRFLFWIHVKRKNETSSWILETSQLDGSSRKVLLTSVNNSILQYPQGLVVLPTVKIICWLSMRDEAINCVSYNGSYIYNKKVSNTESSTIGGTEYYILYTDNQSLYSVDFSSFQPQHNYINSISKVPSFLSVVNTSETAGTGLCLRSRHNCPALCVELSPSYKRCLDFSGVEKFITILHAGTPEGIPLFMTGIENKNVSQSVFPATLFTTQQNDNIDFHVANHTVYWSDSATGSVLSIRRDGKYKQKILSTKETVSGLAVDWVTGNIYWSSVKSASISVSYFNGKHQLVVIHGNLEHPSAVVVSPIHGYLFWGESSNQARIERSTLSGRQRKVIVECNLNSVGDLAVDLSEQHLYWTDPVRGTIERADLNGEGHKIITAENNGGIRPISVAVSMDFVYWTDSFFLEGALIQVNKNNASNMKVMKQGLGAVGKVRIFDTSIQSGSNPCAVNNGGCEQLCFYEGNEIHTCACVFNRLKSDGKSCTAYKSFFLLAHGSKIDSYILEDPLNPNPPLPLIEPPENSFIVALSFDQQQQRIFFSDLMNAPYLFSIDLGTNYVTPLLEGSDVRRIDGLSYDSIHGDLYWTDSAKPSICRLKVDTMGRMRRLPVQMERVLVLDTEDKPRGITVDGCNLFVFWTNWNMENPRIERCYLSGAQKQAIVTKGLARPNGLSLDHLSWSLFWADSRTDGTYAIGSCNLDGSNFKIIAEGSGHHPFSLGVHGSSVYWSDWKTGSLLLTDMQTGKGPAIVHTGLENPMGLVVEAGHTVVCPASSTLGILPESSKNLHHLKCTSFCLNGATCIVLPAKGRTCLCAENFTGEACQTHISTPLSSLQSKESGIFSPYTLFLGIILGLLPLILVITLITVLHKRYHICRRDYCSVFIKLCYKNQPSPLSPECRDRLSTQTQESTLWASSCEEGLTNPLFNHPCLKCVPSSDYQDESLNFSDRAALLGYSVTWPPDTSMNTVM